jgi:hypothetical protein
MTKSAKLRVQDVRGAYRLIGECRDLGRRGGICSAAGSTNDAGKPRPFAAIPRAAA